jgi:hypothetical protein
MPGSQTPADLIFQYTTVLSSSMARDPDTGNNEGMLFNVAGVGRVDFAPSTPAIIGDDNLGEGDDEAEVFGQLGFLARPLPPSGKYHAEAVCLRAGDALTPIACRDTRLRMQGNGPAEGTVAMVGYGGGFLSMSPVGNQGAEGTIQVMYCPYDFNGASVAQKAHTIILDPTEGNEAISVIHSSGAAITMTKNVNPVYGTEMVLKNEDGSATITINNQGITMTGQINLAGAVVIGNPSTAVPLLAGTASPPCSTLFVSP